MMVDKLDRAVRGGEPRFLGKGLIVSHSVETVRLPRGRVARCCLLGWRHQNMKQLDMGYRSYPR